MAFRTTQVHAMQPVVQQVITTQPVVATTTTLVMQQEIRNWSSGICDCCNDIKSCCFVQCCGNFYYACIAMRMQENCCVGLSGDEYYSWIPGGHIAMRTKFRTKHNIQGDICGDCCMMHFCKPCAMCQMAREMDHLGYEPGCC